MIVYCNLIVIFYIIIVTVAVACDAKVHSVMKYYIFNSYTIAARDLMIYTPKVQGWSQRAAGV